MTNPNKIAVFADLHLGVHSNSPQWHDIARNWCKWFISSLKEQNINQVVFCGDWHHNRSEISVDTLHVSAEILSMFKGFKLHIITGNHDQYYKNRADVHSLNIFKDKQDVQIFDKPGLLEMPNGKKFSMLPWGFSLDKAPEGDVCFGHLEIETFQMNIAKQCEDGIKASDLLKKFKLVMSGHFHTRHEKKFSAGTILYVGNPFHMDLGDADNDKGYYILDTDTLKYDFIQNDISPRYAKVKLSEMVAKETLVPEICKVFANNFTKLIIDKNISQEHLNILLTVLNKCKPANINVEYDINYNKIVTNIAEKDFSGIDIRDAIEEFVNLLDIENKKHIIDYTIELYKQCYYKK